MRKLPNYQMRRKQYDAIHYVIHYAALGRMPAARLWLRRAINLHPLSDHQIYRLKMRFDDPFLLSAGVPIKKHQSDGEAMMERLSKKMGGN